MYLHCKQLLVFALLLVTLIGLEKNAVAHKTPSLNAGVKALSSTVSFSSSAEAELITSIPFARTSLGSLILVSVEVNGHDPMAFLVDTGLTEPVIIQKWAADRLRIISSKKIGTFSAHTNPFSLTTLQSLIVKAKDGNEDVEFDSLPAYVSDVELPELGKSHIAGILGLPLFYQFVMQLDFPQHIINLSKQLDHSQLEPSAVCLPLTQHDPAIMRFSVTLPVHSSVIVTRSENGDSSKKVVTLPTSVTDNLFLDTGANTSSLSRSTVSFLHPTAMGAEINFNIEGLGQNNIAFIPKLRLDRFTITDLCVRSPDVQRDQFTADAIGIDILEHFRVTLDFPGKQMFLDHFDNKPSTSAPTTTGIVLEKRDTGFFVQRVLHRSPAEKASLHAGDQITQVDGTPITTDDQRTAQQLLDGNAGTNASLLVFPASGKLRQVTLPRLTLYDPSLYPDYGFLIIKRSLDQAIFVRYILCSSPAWKAGIRAGDVIVAVNKTFIKTTDQARNLLEPWPKRAILSLRRNGKPLTITLRRMPAKNAPPAK